MTRLRCFFLFSVLIILFTLPPAQTWAQGNNPGQESAEEAGTLQVFLALKKNPVIYQEDVECVVMLKNIGTSSLIMKLPALDKSMPIVRVSSLSSGDVREYQRSGNSSPQISSDLTLAAGAVLKNSFSLFAIAPQLGTDVYSISVIWRYDNDSRTAESNSVRLVVLPD